MKNFTFLLAALFAVTSVFAQDTFCSSQSYFGYTSANGETNQVVDYKFGMVHFGQTGSNDILSFLTGAPGFGNSDRVFHENAYSTTLGAIKFLQGTDESLAFFAEGNEVKEFVDGAVTTVVTSPVPIINNLVKLDNGTYVWMGDNMKLYMTGQLDPTIADEVPNAPAGNLTKLTSVGNKVYYGNPAGFGFGEKEDVNTADFSDMNSITVTTKKNYDDIDGTANCEIWADDTNIFLAASNWGSSYRKLFFVSDFYYSIQFGFFYSGNFNTEEIITYGNNYYLSVEPASEVEVGAQKIYVLDMENNAASSVLCHVNGVDASDNVEDLTLVGDNLYFFATPTDGDKGLYVVNLLADSPTAIRVVDAVGGDKLTRYTLASKNYEVMFTTGSGLVSKLFVANEFDSAELEQDTYLEANTIASIYYAPSLNNVFIIHTSTGKSDFSNVSTLAAPELSDTPTSITTLAPQANVTIGPNPVASVLNIAGETVVSVEVFDIAGALVYAETASAISSVNMGDLNSGIYIVKVVTVDGATKTVKIQKR